MMLKYEVKWSVFQLLTSCWTILPAARLRLQCVNVLYKGSIVTSCFCNTPTLRLVWTCTLILMVAFRCGTATNAIGVLGGNRNSSNSIKSSSKSNSSCSNNSCSSNSVGGTNLERWPLEQRPSIRPLLGVSCLSSWVELDHGKETRRGQRGVRTKLQ